MYLLREGLGGQHRTQQMANSILTLLLANVLCPAPQPLLANNSTLTHSLGFHRMLDTEKKFTLGADADQIWSVHFFSSFRTLSSLR